MVCGVGGRMYPCMPHSMRDYCAGGSCLQQIATVMWLAIVTMLYVALLFPQGHNGLCEAADAVWAEVWTCHSSHGVCCAMV